MAWSLGWKVWVPVIKQTNKQTNKQTQKTTTLFLYCRIVQWVRVSHTGINTSADSVKLCKTLK